MKEQQNILHGMWLRQLRYEFRSICSSRKVTLSMPIFEISTARVRYGSWTPETVTLRISEHLIQSYSWDTTVNVLKHEMAHQLCSEYYGEVDAPHGAKFQHACEILGVPESFRSASGDLTAELEADKGSTHIHTDAGRRVISKVKKLLALAGSENEHEAALAMQKARELMDSHNVQQLELDSREGYTYLIIELKKKQVARFQKVICVILKDYFHVEVVLADLYDPLTNEHYKTIELLGREENVAIAEHCYHFLINRLETLWSENAALYKGGRNKGNTRVAKTSYYLGLLEGFRKKLQAQKVTHQANNTNAGLASTDYPALLAAEDHHLNKFVRQRFPSLVRRKSRSMKINKNSYEQGVETGKKIVLHGAMTQKDSEFGGLLE